MEERRTINAPLRLSTAFMCVSLAIASCSQLHVSEHVSVAIDVTTKSPRKANAFLI